jgi:hypothetical protein
LQQQHSPEPDEDSTEDSTEAAPLNRAERRALARGGSAPAPKVAGPAAGRVGPPPGRKRNYAARKSG